MNIKGTQKITRKKSFAPSDSAGIEKLSTLLMNTRPRPQIGPHWPPAYEIFIPSPHHLTRDGANSFIAAVNIVAKRLEKGGPGRAARLPSRRRSAARVKCANGCRWRLLGVQLVRHKLLIFLPVIPFFPQVGGGVSPIKQGRW